MSHPICYRRWCIRRRYLQYRIHKGSRRCSIEFRSRRGYRYRPRYHRPHRRNSRGLWSSPSGRSRLACCTRWYIKRWCLRYRIHKGSRRCSIDTPSRRGYRYRPRWRYRSRRYSRGSSLSTTSESRLICYTRWCSGRRCLMCRRHRVQWRCTCEIQ